MAGDRDSDIDILFGSDGRTAYDDQQLEYRSGLSRVPDDMWAFFADAAEPAAIISDDRPIGSLSIDDGRVHRFHLRPGFEHFAESAVGALRRLRPVSSIVVSTADALAVSVAAPLATATSTVGLLYELGQPVDAPAAVGLRPGTTVDLDRVVDFVAETMGTSPASEVDYLERRVARGELLLEEVDGSIRSIGERRHDEHQPDFAHLGVIVGRDHRGDGVGGAVMRSLVGLAIDEGLTPLASTEPGNRAARWMIHGAGFRSRHSMLCLELAPAAVDSGVG